jgi:hypothetical protein
VELLKLAGRAFVCLVGSIALHAHAQGVAEPAVKAAFLYKFAGYVEWPAPAQPDAPFVFATVAADEVASELAKILPGRAIAGRPAVVRRIREGDSLDGVQMVFIGRQAKDARAAIRAAQRQGALSVTETDLEAGGVINFVVADDRVAFEVSLDAAERGGHRISSRMLAVARRVVPKGAS